MVAEGVLERREQACAHHFLRAPGQGVVGNALNVRRRGVKGG